MCIYIYTHFFYHVFITVRTYIEIHGYLDCSCCSWATMWARVLFGFGQCSASSWGNDVSVCMVLCTHSMAHLCSLGAKAKWNWLADDTIEDM